MNKPKHKHIPLTECKSSQLHSHGYDPETNTLAIRFKNKAGIGAEYRYPNFTAAQYADFCKAESLGSHFGKHIRGNAKHPHFKVEE